MDPKINSLSTYKDYLLELTNKNELFECNDIKEIFLNILAFYKTETIYNISELKKLNISRDACFSSLYCTYIALKSLDTQTPEFDSIIKQAEEMIAVFGQNLLQVEKQYGELARKFNEAYLNAIRDSKEISHKNQTSGKLCIALAEILHIPLTEEEKNLQGLFPEIRPKGKDLIEYNRIAFQINRNLELKKMQEHRDLIQATLSDEEAMLPNEFSPMLKGMLDNYNQLIKFDYIAQNPQHLKSLELQAQHYAKSVGLQLNDNTEYPVIGQFEVPHDLIKWEMPPHLLNFRFVIYTLVSDLFIASNHHSHICKILAFNINVMPMQIEKRNEITNRLILASDALADFYSIEPTIKQWEEIFATSLCLNGEFSYLGLNQAQKKGEMPWLFDFTSKEMDPFLKNYLNDLKTDLKIAGHSLKLRKKLEEKNRTKKPKELAKSRTVTHLNNQLEASNKILRLKYGTEDIEDLYLTLDKQLIELNKFLDTDRRLEKVPHESHFTHPWRKFIYRRSQGDIV